MLTTKYVRDNIDEIRSSLQKRKSDYPIEELLKLDVELRKISTELQGLQAKRNKASLGISDKKKRGENTESDIKTLKTVKDRIVEIEGGLPKLEERVNFLLWNLPNVLDESVPIGMPPEGNKTINQWGKVKNANELNHEDILVKLGFLDLERASKVAGSRFYYLKGDLVLLEQSLIRYVLDKMSKKNYKLISPPFMLKKKYYSGVAPLSVFEDALYKISESNEAKSAKDVEHMEEELFLISTAEHVLAPMHADEVLSTNDLPLKYVGLSPSFRREAGSHGKDTKGIFRVHQFNKIEQFVYCRQEDEQKYFDELLSNSEEFMQDLKIPYRLVLLCSGDTGHQMSKTVDFEGYFPGQKDYRELGSCSSARVWQSMRLNIRYDEKGERKYVYTLNNTGIATQRTLACIVENYFDNGSIIVPDVLVPYMGKSRIG